MSAEPTPGPSRLAGPSLAALGAIASGIGGVGFLIFVGGAVQAARDRGVGLPAPFAVPLVPRTQLLTSGIDQLFNPFVFTMALVGVVAGLLAGRHKLPAASEPWVRWVLLLGLVAFGIQLFREEAGYPGLAPFAIGDRETALLGVIVVLVLGGSMANRLLAPVYQGTPLGRNPRLIGFLVVVAATAMAYSALEVFARNEWSPEVRPIAVLGPQYPKGLIGVDVGEDENYVYVGIISGSLSEIKGGSFYAPLPGVSSKRLQARIIEVKRSNVEAVSVGGLFPLTNYPAGKTASQRAREMGLRVRLVRAEEGLLQELQAGATGPRR